MKKLSDFQNYYQQDIVPKLTPLEERRLASLRKKQLLLLAVLSLLLLHAGLIFYKFLPLWSVIISAILVPTLAAWAFNRFYTDEDLARDFRWALAYETLNFSLGASRHTPDHYISYKDFQKSQLFLQDAEHFFGNGLGIGELGGNKVKFSVLEAAYQRQQEKDWVYIFRGVFMMVDCKKNFEHKAQILPSQLEKDFGIFGEKIKKKNFHRGYGIKVEHEAFSKNFVAYCTNRSEGRELFDQDLAQAVSNFYKSTSLKPFLCFYENHVYLAIEIPDIQYFTLLQTLLKPKWAETIFEPLQELLDAIAAKTT